MRAIVTGGSSGLGAAIASMLKAEKFSVGIWDLNYGIGLNDGIDISDERCVSRAAAREKHVDILVNCAGLNRIGYITDLSVAYWQAVMDVNAKGIFLTAKHLAPKMRGGTICNIVSNASHKPMTASIAYNASKGAAAIMTSQMARELVVTHGITTFAVSPGRMAGTTMSHSVDIQVAQVRGWSAEETKSRQGVEIPVQSVAEFITFLLSKPERHKYLNGCDIPYGGYT